MKPQTLCDRVIRGHGRGRMREGLSAPQMTRTHIHIHTDMPGKEKLSMGKAELDLAQGHMRWSDGITHSMDMSLSKLRELVMGREVCCSPWSCKESDTIE